MSEPLKLENRPMTESLEDYLETIYNLIGGKKVARVKDIARERQVSMASVSTAMRKLHELGLVNYTQREYIELTEKGEQTVRRIVTRHEILRRFFADFLRVDPKVADADACLVEHHLSDETVDRFVHLLEYLENCPDGQSALSSFQSCREFEPSAADCDPNCGRRLQNLPCSADALGPSLDDLAPGERGMITKIKACGPLRQRLIDMGMLPHTEVEVERVAPSGDPIWIKLRGFNLSLRKEEAQGIMVQPV